MNFLGFTNEDQKDAFNFICHYADVNWNGDFSVQSFLKLVDSMQKNLVNRANRQERWEVKDLEWMNKHQNLLLPKFKTLGFIDALVPKKKFYDCVCILGARLASMRERLHFFKDLLAKGLNTRRVVLLTGERYIKEDIDGSREELLPIANYFSMNIGNLTEAKIFQYLYETSDLYSTFEPVIIDTPQRDNFRPTTKTTLDEFCAWNKLHPDVKTALFISTQPFVRYQKSIISEALWINNSTLSFEVAGDAYNFPAVKTLAGALGSYIWVVMPSLLRRFGMAVNSNLSLVKKLYAHQPWLYNGIPIKF